MVNCFHESSYAPSHNFVRTGLWFFITSCFFTGDLSPAYSFINHVLYIAYLPLLDLDYYEGFLKLSSGFTNYIPFPNFFAIFSDSCPTNGHSERLGLPSALLLLNVGRHAMFCFFLVAELLLVLAMNYTKLGSLFKSYHKISLLSRLNFFVRWTTFAFIDLLAAAAIQISEGFDNSGFGVMNMICTIIFLALLVCVPCYLAFIILSSIPTFDAELMTDRPHAYIARWPCWFSEFKSNNEALHNCYYLFYYTKRALLVLSGVLLKNPMHQLVVNVSACAMCISQLYAYFPFKTKLLNYCSLYAEVTLIFFITAQDISKHEGFQQLLVVIAFSGCASYLVLQCISVLRTLQDIIAAKVPEIDTTDPGSPMLSSHHMLGSETRSMSQINLFSPRSKDDIPSEPVSP